MSELDDLLNLGGKSLEELWSNFTRPVRDSYPVKVYTVDNGYMVVCNALGIQKEDLTIKIVNKKGLPYPRLIIKGTTEMEKINFKNSIDYAASLKFSGKVEGMQYELKNGLAIIYIKIEQAEDEETTIDAKFKDSDDTLEF